MGQQTSKKTTTTIATTTLPCYLLIWLWKEKFSNLIPFEIVQYIIQAYLPYIFIENFKGSLFSFNNRWNAKKERVIKASIECEQELLINDEKVIKPSIAYLRRIEIGTCGLNWSNSWRSLSSKQFFSFPFVVEMKIRFNPNCRGRETKFTVQNGAILIRNSKNALSWQYWRDGFTRLAKSNVKTNGQWFCLKQICKSSQEIEIYENDELIVKHLFEDLPLNKKDNIIIQHLDTHVGFDIKDIEVYHPFNKSLKL
ncbi:hypothetical protein ABK040_005525 [Willaertia magna]